MKWIVFENEGHKEEKKIVDKAIVFKCNKCPHKTKMEAFLKEYLHKDHEYHICKECNNRTIYAHCR